MPKSYLEDLRWRIVLMVTLQGKPISEVAREMYMYMNHSEEVGHDHVRTKSGRVAPYITLYKM